MLNREVRSERPSTGWASELGWVLAFGVVLSATAYHLLMWTLTFNVVAYMSFPVALILWSGIVFRTGGLASYDPENPWWVSWVRAFVLLPAFFGPFLVAWAVTGERDTVLFEWSWIYTLAVLVAAVVLERLAKRSVGQE